MSKDYSKKEIEEAVTGTKEQFVNLKARLRKWDLILNEIHEDLKYLHEDFDKFYKAVEAIEGDNESLERQTGE